jgi:hypothetical protein
VQLYLKAPPEEERRKSSTPINDIRKQVQEIIQVEGFGQTVVSLVLETGATALQLIGGGCANNDWNRPRLLVVAELLQQSHAGFTVLQPQIEHDCGRLVRPNEICRPITRWNEQGLITRVIEDVPDKLKAPRRHPLSGHAISLCVETGTRQASRTNDLYWS